MAISVRMKQARCAALGFWPGPIDGKDGKRTQAAYAAAVASQKAKGRPFVHPSGISRIHLHWTGGVHKPNATDKKHYHALYFGDGAEVILFDWAKILAHTLNANPGAIGLGACGMAAANEIPFRQGSAPVTLMSLNKMCRRAALLCKEFDIPITRWSLLTHAEVQPTLGIAQRQKWDINWIPGMAGPTDPISAGDRLRTMVVQQMTAL